MTRSRNTTLARHAGRGVGVLALVLSGLIAASLASGTALGQSAVLSIFMSDSPDPVTVGDRLTLQRHGRRSGRGHGSGDGDDPD